MAKAPETDWTEGQPAWSPKQVEIDILRIDGLLRYRRGNLSVSTVRELEALREQLQAVQRDGGKRMSGEIWRIEKADGGPDCWRLASDERYPSKAAAAQAMWDQFPDSHTNPHAWRVVQTPD